MASFSRRKLLKAMGLGASAAVFPELWLPRAAKAQTVARGMVRHIVYIRLTAGFRFTAAFNGDVNGNFNPYGRAGSRAAGTQWGPSSLLESATWLTDPLRQLGMAKVTDFSNEICVLPCVDHEPAAAGGDGNHGTGLQRFLTGYLGGSTAFLTYANYGLRQQTADALLQGRVLLPAFSLGEAGMSTGAGVYSGYRPPVLDGAGFQNFAQDPEEALPAWARTLAQNLDSRTVARVSPPLVTPIESYRLTRSQAHVYNLIFNDALLKVDNRSNTMVDGISNQQLEQIFGANTTGRRAALACRLFHFGCPVAFFNQGGYDTHSREEDSLPQMLDEACRLLAGFRAAFKRMQHPEGGTYWDKTLVVMGSEFGRTAGDNRFNSAGGTDHGSDRATRWMSMPIMGGVIDQAGRGGATMGSVNPNTLAAQGAVYSYRSFLKTLLDALGADHASVFPADTPIMELFA